MSRAADQLLISGKIYTEEELEAFFEKFSIEEGEEGKKLVGRGETVDEIRLAFFFRVFFHLGREEASRPSIYKFHSLGYIRLSQEALAKRLEPELSSYLDRFVKKQKDDLRIPHMTRNNEFLASCLRDAGYTVEEMMHDFDTQIFTHLYLPDEKIAVELFSRARLMKAKLASHRTQKYRELATGIRSIEIRQSFLNMYRYQKAELIEALKLVIKGEKDTHELFLEKVAEKKAKRRENYENKRRGGRSPREEEAQESTDQSADQSTQSD